MKRKKHEELPSEYRDTEIQIRTWDRLESLPTFYPDGRGWKADLEINGRNIRQ